MLVSSNPTELGWLAEGFAPIRRILTPGLRKIYSDSESDQLRTATFLLAEFASDDEEALVDILQNAMLHQLSAVAPAILEAEPTIDPILLAALDRVLQQLERLDPAMATDNRSIGFERQPRARAPQGSSRRVALARQCGNLAAMLLQRGQPDRILPLLKSSPDPTLRSYIVQCYASSAGPAQPLVDLMIDGSGDQVRLSAMLERMPDVAAALLQVLGTLPASSHVPPSVRAVTRQLYRSSNHGELNATAEWFLRSHGYDNELGDFDAENGVVYRTRVGHTMVRIPGGIKATVGASSLDANRLPNEDRHEIAVPDEIYFSRQEVTAAEFNRFREDRGLRPRRFESGSEAVTAMRIVFYQAAEYCNWLSELEGISEDQWCYLPNADGAYAAGMSLASDHLSRSGYQMPTPDLWEYACRGGSETPRPFGYGVELSSPYVRWMGSRRGSSRASSLRRPNGFGLFDMLGNASEWSMSLVPKRGPTGSARARRVPVCRCCPVIAGSVTASSGRPLARTGLRAAQ